MAKSFINPAGTEATYRGSDLEGLLKDSLSTVYHFYLVSIEGNGQVYNYTTSAFDVTAYGTNWSSDNGIVGISPIINTNFLDRELFNIEMFDTDELPISQNRHNFVGGRLLVYLTFWNQSNDSVVGGFNSYRGFIDRVHEKTDTSTKRTIVLECTGEVSNLEHISGYVGSNEGRKQVNPSDTSFQNISRNVEEIRQFWGRF